jgi:hypothetical protein
MGGHIGGPKSGSQIWGPKSGSQIGVPNRGPNTVKLCIIVSQSLYRMQYLVEYYKCGDTSISYFVFMYVCVLKQARSLDEFMALIHFDIEKMLVAELEPKKMYLTRQNVSANEFWYPVLHRTYGYCYIFDASLVSGYELVEISDLYGNPSIHLIINEFIDNSPIRLFLHSGHDSADAVDLYPSFEIRVGR